MHTHAHAYTHRSYSGSDLLLGLAREPSLGELAATWTTGTLACACAVQVRRSEWRMSGRWISECPGWRTRSKRDNESGIGKILAPHPIALSPQGWCVLSLLSRSDTNVLADFSAFDQLVSPALIPPPPLTPLRTSSHHHPSLHCTPHPTTTPSLHCTPHPTTTPSLFTYVNVPSLPLSQCCVSGAWITCRTNP